MVGKLQYSGLGVETPPRIPQGKLSYKRILVQLYNLALKNTGIPRLPSFPLTKRFKRALLPAIPAYLENFPFTTYNTTQSKMDGDF